MEKLSLKMEEYTSKLNNFYKIQFWEALMSKDKGEEQPDPSISISYTIPFLNIGTRPAPPIAAILKDAYKSQKSPKE